MNKREYIMSYILDDTNALIERRISSSGEILEKNIFLLTEISEEDIFLKRANGKPGFILKVNDCFYFSEITKKTKLLSYTEHPHLCDYCSLETFFSCQKVCQRAFETYNPLDRTLLILYDSKRIEKYDFINFGFETFGTLVNTFCVVECKNFKLGNSKPYKKEKI